MKPYFENEWGKLYHGDCLEIMQGIEAESIHAIVTDPPYGLGFMGKEWDALPPGVDVMMQCLRVCLPGSHMIAFGGSRTYHRLACAVEDAGFEIRDQIQWIYGSGFPKSLNISKAIDKVADEEKAKQWNGFGTALKPAHEPAVLARKPVVGTVAQNVLKYGTGALNIDGCRVGTETRLYSGGMGRFNAKAQEHGYRPFTKGIPSNSDELFSASGRWPANLVHDGSDEVVRNFPQTGVSSGGSGAASMGALGKTKYNKYALDRHGANAGGFGDSGSAARFFYCAKASKKERGEGNNHPTVKPISLMSYLITLICPMGATVLDPFGGSGTTALAAQCMGRKWVLIEKEESYCEIIARRLQNKDMLFRPTPKAEAGEGNEKQKAVQLLLFGGDNQVSLN